MKTFLFILYALFSITIGILLFQKFPAFGKEIGEPTHSCPPNTYVRYCK